MDVSEYRKQYAEQLQQAVEQQTTFRDLLSRSKATAGAPSVAAAAADFGAGAAEDLTTAVEVLRDKHESIELRTQALEPIGITLATRHDLIDVVLSMLRDATEPVELRKAALRTLQQASFRAVAFAPKRPDYLAALRSLIDDKDADLRRRVIGILAREADEYVQRRLIEGLEQPSKALVPAAKAIQFLGYDIHAEHFPILREIVRRPPNRAAQKEAVRLLGSDPSSKDLLAEILEDKSESPDVRNVSAIALQTLDPDQFEELAKRIALDDTEDDRLRASCISALTHFANPATLTDNAEFTRGVEQLREKSPSRQVKQATAAYILKYGA
jgi:hypothetical protein